MVKGEMQQNLNDFGCRIWDFGSCQAKIWNDKSQIIKRFQISALLLRRSYSMRH
jgi:hypothetical protein